VTFNFTRFNLLKIKSKKDKQLATSIYCIFDFYPRNINLYKIALHHKSSPINFKNTQINNERMEYLGDAILSAIVAEYLYKIYPLKNEGFLSEMRAKIVSRKQLNKLCKNIGLYEIIEHNCCLQNSSVAGDAFEAFIGAMFLDKGFYFTKKILTKHILLNHLDIKVIETQNSNFKSKLIEWCQKQKKEIEFKVTDEILANGYPKQYIVESYLDGKNMCSGCDYNIKGAEQIASKKTLELLNLI
jgi:ribonuclease-3